MPNISLSFDDSRRDFYSNVFPLLKKYNVPATLNVITERVMRSKEEDQNRSYMTIDEVKDCAASGLVEIASHSENHRNHVDDVVLRINQLSDWNSWCYSTGGVRKSIL